MTPSDDGWNDDAESFDDDDAPDAAAAETESDVWCPHCGKTVTIALDPAGGRAQDYVEDCEACCRPWRVRVWYDAAGAAEVQLHALE